MAIKKYTAANIDYEIKLKNDYKHCCGNISENIIQKIGRGKRMGQ